MFALFVSLLLSLSIPQPARALDTDQALSTIKEKWGLVREKVADGVDSARDAATSQRARALKGRVREKAKAIGQSSEAREALGKISHLWQATLHTGKSFIESIDNKLRAEIFHDQAPSHKQSREDLYP